MAMNALSDNVDPITGVEVAKLFQGSYSYARIPKLEKGPFAVPSPVKQAILIHGYRVDAQGKTLFVQDPSSGPRQEPFNLVIDMQRIYQSETSPMRDVFGFTPFAGVVLGVFEKVR